MLASVSLLATHAWGQADNSNQPPTVPPSGTEAVDGPRPRMIAPKPTFSPTTIFSDPAEGQTADATPNASPELDRLLTQLVLRHLPHEYVDDDDWGQTSERWDGLEVERDGLRVETRRRRKSVNHGTWTRYSAKLRDPESSFEVQAANFRAIPGRGIAFDLHCVADLALSARQSKWVKGVQLYSLSADGHALVHLWLQLELEFRIDPLGFPVELSLVPRATAANIAVDEFRIDRISKLGGEFAQQVSRSVRHRLDREVEAHSEKLAEKLNGEFEEHADDLKISIPEARSTSWTRQAEEFLPLEIRNLLHAGKSLR